MLVRGYMVTPWTNPKHVRSDCHMPVTRLAEEREDRVFRGRGSETRAVKAGMKR
jgi:hypothetical protein